VEYGRTTREVGSDIVPVLKEVHQYRRAGVGSVGKGEALLREKVNKYE
jgi:hypothetical protein